MTGRRVARLGAVVAAGALVAGCSNGTPSQELSPTDQARAENINFNAADFPAGWSKASAVTAAGEGGGDEVERMLQECLTQEPEASSSTADVGSERFQLGAQRVSSNVTFARSEASARADLADVKTARAQFCFKQSIETVTRELEPVPTSVDQTTTTVFLTDVGAEPLPLAARYGDDSVALRATAVLRTIRGDDILVTSDLVVFVRGRALVFASFVSSPAAFPSDLEQALMAKIAARA
jgi:outer membrane murein-binding lipoprotein Lpp